MFNNFIIFLETIIEFNALWVKHIYFNLIVVYQDGRVATLGKLQILSIYDLEYIIRNILNELGLKLDWYKSVPISEVVIQYTIKSGNVPKKTTTTTSQNLVTQKYYNNKLPLYMVCNIFIIKIRLVWYNN